MLTHHLSYDEQLQLFKDRGMDGIANFSSSHHSDQNRSIRTIGYYKLKQYTYPFWNQDSNKYSHITYDQVIKRYYQDQQLKQCLFQAIGDIEASINSSIAYVLGKKDPWSYTDFDSWCQKSGYNRFLKSRIRYTSNGLAYNVDKYVLKKEELIFLQRVISKVKRSSLRDISKFEESSSNVYPSVWLMINTLTFGESIYLFKLMSKKNRKKVADMYHKRVNDMISWLELLNLIRNICCHNGDLVDISLKTMPKIPTKYHKYLKIENGNLPHKAGIVICIVLELMYEINPKYQVKKEIMPYIQKLCKLNPQYKDKAAESIGFRNYESIEKLFDIFYEKPTTILSPDGSFINE